MKVKSKFTISRNPQLNNGEVFIIHHHSPIIHLRVWTEPVTLDSKILIHQFEHIINYPGDKETEIIPVTFELTHYFAEGPGVNSWEIDLRQAYKVMRDAQFWYLSLT